MPFWFPAPGFHHVLHPYPFVYPYPKPKRKPPAEIRYVVPGSDEYNPPFGGIAPGFSFASNVPYTIRLHEPGPGLGFLGKGDDDGGGGGAEETCTMHIVPPTLHPTRGLGMEGIGFNYRIIKIRLDATVGELLDRIGGQAKDEGVTRVVQQGPYEWSVNGSLLSDAETRQYSLSDVGCKAGEVYWLAQGADPHTL